MGSGLFHLTLAMLRLHGDEGIDEATKLVEGLQDELQELLSKRGDKKAGIECFESISSFSFLCFIQSTQCKVPFYNILMLIFDATLEARQNLNLIPFWLVNLLKGFQTSLVLIKLRFDSVKKHLSMTRTEKSSVKESLVERFLYN